MNRLAAIAIIAGAAGLTGCQQYLARQDLIVSPGGDAVARNLALQTPDPWPHYVYDNDIPTSGQRQGDAFEAYQKANENQEAVPLTPLQLVVPQQ